MSLTTRTIPALHNGISLQPPILRSPDQTDDEVNTWGDIAVGLGRRPPTQHIAHLSVDIGEGAFIHHINRDRNERYVVIIAGGEIVVYDELTGVEHPVATPFGADYLSGPPTAFRAVTVADHTFIVNSSVEVSMAAAGEDETAPPAYAGPGGYLAWGSSIP